MITVNNLSLQFGKRVLFDNVNIKFHGVRCYGVIGANGAGKSTFLIILNSEIEPNSGNVSIDPEKRLSILKQDLMNIMTIILQTVMMGHHKLWDIMQKKDAIYAKPDFSDQDGIEVGKLEEMFQEMDGWSAESNAADMLCGMGVPTGSIIY